MSGDVSYGDFVQAQFWDKLSSGTYGAGNDLDAAEYADAILSARTGQNYRDLVAWDLSKVAIAAHMAGEISARNAFMQRIRTSLEDAQAPHNSVDVIGLAGGLWAGVATGIQLDPISGPWAGASNNSDLANILQSYQTPNGGFVTSSTQAVIDANASGQTTAFALQALVALNPVLYQTQIHRGFSFLSSLQLPSGQLLDSAGGNPNADGGIEVHGEIMEAYANGWIHPDRYVAKTGNDASNNDCSVQSNPCLTIQKAVNEADAGNTVHIDSGIYSELVVIAGVSKSGLRLIGEGVTQPVLSFGSGATNQTLLTISGATAVAISNLGFDVDVSYVAEGILCVNACSGLDVSGSSFLQRQSTGARSSYGRTNAISVIGNGTIPAAVHIVDNLIEATAGVTAFRAGVAVDYGYGQIGACGGGLGNDIISTNHDVIVRTGQGGPMTIACNTFRGFGVQINAPTTTSGTITVADNQFTPTNVPAAPVVVGDFSAMRLIQNGNGIAAVVSGNNFNGHERGVLVENFPDVTLADNTFTPRNGSSTFVHVIVSNKALFSGTPVPPYAGALSLTATGNTFAGSTIAGGTAVELLNDNASGEPVGGYYGNLEFGGIGAHNDFDSDLRWFFKLDDYTCASSNAAPCPLASIYTLTNAGIIGTPVVPFAADFSAVHNRVDGIDLAGAATNPATQSLVLTKTFDQRANAVLGRVNYDFATPASVYVDDNYVGSAYGTALSFSHPQVSPGTIHFGIDAFATIADGLAAVASGGNVYVASGTYIEGNPSGAANLEISRPVNVIGAQAGVDARNRSDANASIVRPARVNASLTVDSVAAIAILDIFSSNVRIDGLVFDGDNTAATSGVNINGANPDVDSGIFAHGDNIVVVNNVVRNLVYGGIIGYNFDIHTQPARVGNVIQHNWVHNLDAPSNWGLGILLQWNYYADVSDNLLTDVRLAIQTNYFTRPVLDPATNAVISGNEIRASRRGIFHNYADADSGLGDPSAFIIDGNVISANANPLSAGPWEGIVVQAFFDGTAIVTNNQIDGALVPSGRLRTGYLASNLLAAAGPIALDGGSVAHVDYGVLATDGAFYTGAVNDVQVRNIAFSDIAIAALHAEDTALVGAETIDNAVRLTVGTGNVFAASVAQHGALSGPLAQIEFAPGASLLSKVLVRAAGNGHRGTDTDVGGNVRTVNPGIINSAIADTADSGVVTLAAGNFNQRVSVNKNNIRVQGAGATSILDGTAIAGSGVQIEPGITGTTLSQFAVRNFVLLPDSNSACVAGVAGNDDSVVEQLTISACGGSAGRGGIYFNGPVDNVTIHDNTLSNIGPSSGNARAIVIWNGLKSNITITDNTVSSINGCCGIELQDGSAAGVNISGNTISGTGDSGMGVIGLTAGAGPNIIRNNIISNNGRYGIEIKNPDGSGNDITNLDGPFTPADDGAIVVTGNTVTMTGPTPTSAHDVAGIAVIRRGVTAGNVQVPSGVIVRGNTVSGWTQPGANDGFGIVVEGVRSSVFDNTVTGSDIAIQLQAGNTPAPPGDTTGAETSDFFARGNAATTCSFVGSNIVNAASVSGSTRNVSNPASAGLQGGVVNQRTQERFCSIQVAIDDADTLAGDTLVVDAGTYAETITINKSLTLLGAKANIAGDGQTGAGANPAARDGSGESVIAPATAGVGVTLAADQIVFNGFTIRGASTGHAVQRPGGQLGDDLRFINNRVLDVVNGSGIFSEPGSVAGAGDGFVISNNFFSNILGSGSENGRGIVLFKGTSNAEVIDNRFDGMQQHALQANGGNGALTGLVVTGNVAVNTLLPASATAYVITGTTNAVFRNNTANLTGGGLFISDRMINFEASCNVLSAVGSGVSTLDFFSNAASSNVRIFHNAISGGSADIRNGLTQGITIGSNWYSGAAASTAVQPGAPLPLVADPLIADPTNGGAFDISECGDNNAFSHVFYPASGAVQSADLNQPFAESLRSRVQDQLGGAVMGATVTVSAPTSGASALLTPALVAGSLLRTTNYNGVVESTAIANGFAGTYNVTATHDSGARQFALTNVALAQVQFDLNGPVGGVEVGDQVAYTGALGNTNPNVTEKVRILVQLAGTSPLDPADAVFCVINPADPSQCLPVTWTDGGATLSFAFPDVFGDVGGFAIDAPLPYAYTHNFRMIYGEAGVFTATAQVVGVTSNTVYASDVISTEVIAPAAGVSLDLTGPISGVQSGTATEYLARLVNTEAAVRDDVMIELAISGPAGFLPADVLIEADTGAGYQALTVSAGALPDSVALVLRPAFVLGANPFEQLTPLRITYARNGSFAIAATVVDALTPPGLDGVETYAADQLLTTVVEPNADIDLNLSGPFAAADGTTAVSAEVHQQVLLRADLANAGGDVADLVQAGFVITADYAGIAPTDIEASYWFVLPSQACAPIPAIADRESVVFAAGIGSIEASTTPQPLPEATELAVCFEITFKKAGVFNIGATIEDAAADSDGTPIYAVDNLAISVVDASAAISLGNLATVVFNGAARAATVTTTPSTLTYTLTYTEGNGTPTTTAPIEAGTYAVQARIDDGQGYSGTANGTLTIAPKPVTIALSGVGDYAYDGSARVATASAIGLVAGYPLGAPLQITYNGAASVPVNAGAYAVAATVNASLVRNYSVQSAVGAIGILKSTIAVNIDASDLLQSFGATRAVDASATPLPLPALQTVQVLEVRYNGSLAVPSLIGTYSVVATVYDSNYEGSAGATLVIGDGAAVTLELDPIATMAQVGTTTPGYTEFVNLGGALGNSGTITSQPVHYRINVTRIDDGNGSGGNPVAIALDDVKMCIYDASGYAAQAPEHDGCPVDYQYLFKSSGSLNGRTSVLLRYPNIQDNDLPLPTLDPAMALPPANLRLRPGEYRVQVDVVGSTTGTVYASSVTNTTTVPSAHIAYSGAASGDAEDLLLSTTRLRNQGGRVDGNVVVRVTLSDAAATDLAPIALATGDADLMYQDGADYLPLTWLPTPAADGGLVSYFGAAGFALEDGYDVTTAGAGVFHRLGNYRLRYEVLDAATMSTLFADSTVAIAIVPNAVVFDLSDLSQTYNGDPRLVTVTPSNVTHTVVYQTLTESGCSGPSITPIAAGSYCVAVNATGSYSGSATGTLVVAPATSAVTIDGASAGVVQRAFNNAQQVVTATGAPAVAGFVITYNGSTTAPSAAGSYSVLATVADPNYIGSATATLIISTDNGATIVLVDDDSTVDGTIHRVYTGAASAVTATTTPAIAYRVTYVGAGATAYPLTETAPSLVGEYQVVATTTDANYVDVSASGTLRIEPATAVVDISAASLSAVYDGQPHAVTATTTPAALALAYSYTGIAPTVYPTSAQAPRNAGSYAVTATITSANHVGSDSDTLVITPASASINFAVIGPFVYNSLPQSPLVNAGGVAITLSYSGTTAAGLAFGPTALPPTDAGSYTLTATVADANYAAAPAVQAYTIGKATAQVTLSNLIHIFNNAPKAATVTTVPASLPVTVVYTPAVPLNVGNYAVVATVDDANHQGSSNGTLTILAAAVAQVVGDSPTPVSGIAGATLAAADLPTVRVLDNNGNGVAGISILFETDASSGSAIGAVATTDSNGKASVGGWALDADAGVNTMTARVNGLAGLPTLSFTATGAENAGVALSKTSTATTASAGNAITYTIVVAHAAGPSNAAAVDVLDLLPDGLDVANATWLCAGSGGASCGVASGTGDVDVTVAIPVAGSVTVTVTATVEADAAIGPLVNTALAELTSSIDADTSDNSDDHTINIVPAVDGECAVFCDGFEDDNSVLLAQPKALGVQPALRLLPSPITTGVPVLLFEALDSAGAAVASIDGLRVGDRTWFRVRHRDAGGSERFSAWKAMSVSGLQFDWVTDAAGDVVRIGNAGKSSALQFPKGALKAAPHRLRLQAVRVAGQ